MKQICKYNDCTACRLCEQVCSKKAIEFIYDETGNLYPYINNNCIDCGSCIKLCPSVNLEEKNNPFEVYAGWNTNIDIRKNSASGGIATALYKMAINKNWYFSGVRLNEEFKVYQELTNDESLIKEFQNSKYVFSDMHKIYRDIKEKLSKDKCIIFIGVPCQVAATKNYMNIKNENLILIDLICHGFASTKYFQEHINYIENISKRKIKKIYFRDPDAGTNNYITSFFDNNGEKMYMRKILDDNYQLAYHHRLSYRENCYRCKYACPKRVGDLTIGDFSGLGRLDKVDFDSENISCILVNTEKGKKILELLNVEGYVEIRKRPINEALNFEHQLRTPVNKNENRNEFLRLYKNGMGFDQAVGNSMSSYRRKVFIKNKILGCESNLKKLLLKILPKYVVLWIRNYKIFLSNYNSK